MTTGNVSVVVIHRNGKQWLAQCLEAIEKSTLKPVEVIMVDDCSDDKSVGEYIASHFPTVHFVQQQEWRGPTAARNAGAQIAKGDYILFLDCDVSVNENCIEELVRVVELHRHVAAVGAQLLSRQGEHVQWTCGYDPHHGREIIACLLGFMVKRMGMGYLRPVTARFTFNYIKLVGLTKVDWLCEGAFMVRRGSFEKVSGFDERFVIDFEGPDLCRRLRQNGYTTCLAPKAKAFLDEHHATSPTTRTKLWLQSKQWYYRKHYGIGKIRFWIGQVLAGIAYKLV